MVGFEGTQVSGGGGRKNERKSPIILSPVTPKRVFHIVPLMN